MSHERSSSRDCCSRHPRDDLTKLIGKPSPYRIELPGPTPGKNRSPGFFPNLAKTLCEGDQRDQRRRSTGAFIEAACVPLDSGHRSGALERTRRSWRSTPRSRPATSIRRRSSATMPPCVGSSARCIQRHSQGRPPRLGSLTSAPQGVDAEPPKPTSYGFRALSFKDPERYSCSTNGQTPGPGRPGGLLPQSRVWRWHYRHPLASELHVKVSPHAAQAFTNAPRRTRPLLSVVLAHGSADDS